MATIGGRNGIFSAQQNLSVAVSFQDLHSRDSKALVMLDFKDFCSVLVQYLSLSLFGFLGENFSRTRMPGIQPVPLKSPGTRGKPREVPRV